MLRRVAFAVASWFFDTIIGLWMLAAQGLGRVAVGVLWLIDRDRLAYFSALGDQRHDLDELGALAHAMRLQRQAGADGDWGHHLIAGMDEVADVLIERHSWSPEQVDTLSRELSGGALCYLDRDDEDFDDEDFDDED